jgi:hypothetical protein
MATRHKVNPKENTTMKTMILSAVAAALISTAASADAFDNAVFRTSAEAFDNAVLMTTVTTGNLEFSAATIVDTNVETYVLGGGAYFNLGPVGELDATLFVFGQYANIADVGVGVVGAEYILSKYSDRTALELTGQVAYVALTDDFDNGDVFLTPIVNFEYNMNEEVAVFSEVGYTWNLSNDFNGDGGYVQVGLDVGITDLISIRPSIVKPFDAVLDGEIAVVELNFNF